MLTFLLNMSTQLLEIVWLCRHRYDMCRRSSFLLLEASQHNMQLCRSSKLYVTADFCIGESTQLLSTSTHLLYYCRSILVCIEPAVQYVNAHSVFLWKSSWVRRRSFSIRRRSLFLWLKCQPFFLTCQHSYLKEFDCVDADMICVDVPLFFFLNQVSTICSCVILVSCMFIDSVDTSFKCVDLLVTFLLTVSTHPSSVSTCLWYFC